MIPQNQVAPSEEEDSDYDVFAKFRPRGIQVDDNPSDEEEGQDLDPYAAYRPKAENIQTAKQERQKPKTYTVGQIAKDVAKQGAKELLIGVGGTWGDLAELAGINPQESEAIEQKRFHELDVLDRMNEPGYKPSIYDIEALTSDQSGPESFPLPTSKGLRKANELLGGPGEAETPAGKYASRSANLYGAGLAFGQANPLPAIAGGVAGQAAEDLGAGPLTQAGVEIAAMLLTPAGGKAKLVGSAKKEVQQKINELRKLGYTDKDITLAINSASKGKKGGIKASKGSKTEQAFEDFAEHSDQIVNDILASSVQGFEKGPAYVHQLASDAYGVVAKEAANLTITNSKPFLDASKKVVDELQKTLGTNPEAGPFIKRISDAAIHSTQYPNADSFINFYKELNQMGNWLGRSQKDRLISQVKNGIKDTFRSEGKAGKQLADKFEQVNEGVRKAYLAEDVFDIMQKATTQDGIDYKKLTKAFDKPDNVKLFEEVLGATKANNIKYIAKTGKEIKDFDKAWKATHLLKGNTLTDIGLSGAAGYYLWKGDMEGLLGVASTKIGAAGAKKLAEQFLTNPKFQNLFIKGLHALKNESPRAFQSANNAMQKYLDDEGINVKL